MAFFLAILAAFFFGAGVHSAALAAHEPRTGHRLTYRLRSSAGYTLGSLTLMLFFIQAKGLPQDSKMGPTLHVLLLLAGVLTAVTLVIFAVRLWQRTRYRRRLAETSPRQSLREQLQYGYRLTLPGWKKETAPNLHREAEDGASRSSLLVNLGATALLVPGVLLLVAGAIVMNVQGSSASDLAGKAVGYYTLLIATCWTLLYILTILFVAVQQTLRGKGEKLSYSSMAVSLGTWAGLGAAGGVFVGALTPAVVLILPIRDFGELDASLLSVLSPSLLLDMSTAGAIFGFLIGEIISLVDLAGGEENLFIKVVLPPLFFGGAASALGSVGLRPGVLSKRIATEYQRLGVTQAAADGTTDPLDIVSSSDPQSYEAWASVVVSFEQNSWNQILDQQFYFLFTWAVVALVILFAFTLRLHKRELFLATVGGAKQKATRRKDAGPTPSAPESDPAHHLPKPPVDQETPDA